MTTSISSEALLNYKKVTWKMKVKKREEQKETKISKSPQSHETFEPISKSFTIMFFIA